MPADVCSQPRAPSRIASSTTRAPTPPTLEIARIVADRCLRAGLPIPSRKSLVARIAYVRRNGAPGERAYLHQITLDHCVLTDGTGTAATLSIAVLEPPGAVVAWRLSARPADAVTTAMLIHEAHMRASGDEPARISARFGRDPGYAAIGAALSQARIDVVGGSAIRQLHGATARCVLGRTIAGLTIRRKKPAACRWADEADLTRSSAEIAVELDAVGPRRRPGRPFRIASAYDAPSLVRALAAIRSSEQKVGPGKAEEKDLGAAPYDG